MWKTLGQKIKDLRDEFGVTQEKLADQLKITRQTLSQVETDDRALKVNELKKLADYFDIEVEYFLRDEKAICDNQYPFDRGKFKSMLLYILEKCGSKPNVGETVIYKLLYFCDFGFYEKSNYKKFLTGASYTKMAFGPAPCDFTDTINKMIDSKKVQRVIAEYNGFLQKKYIPLVGADISKLEKEEIDFIDKVIEKYSNYKAKEISRISHKQVPWRIADYNTIIKYEDLALNKEKII